MAMFHTCVSTGTALVWSSENNATQSATLRPTPGSSSNSACTCRRAASICWFKTRSSCKVVDVGMDVHPGSSFTKAPGSCFILMGGEFDPSVLTMLLL